MNNNCIFCKIAKGEIPSNKVYEDKDFLVFLDIKPVNHGHLLVVPRKHIVWMQDADDKIISDIFKLSKKMMLALKKGLKCDYIQVSIIGNEVPHFHVHLIPRYKSDNFKSYPTKEYKDIETKKIVNKITKSIK